MNTLKTFNVGIREVHIVTRQVQAEDADDALSLAHKGEGEELMVEYSHTMSQDNCTVEEVDSSIADREEQQRRDEKNGLYPGKEDPAN